MAKNRKSRVVLDTRGVVAIEYGIILPALLLFTLGVMEIGRLIWTSITLNRAADAAARYAAVCDPTIETCTNIQQYAVSQAWGINDITASAFTLPAPTCGDVQHPAVEVDASYTFTFLIPWVTPTVSLKAKACYPKQQLS